MDIEHREGGGVLALEMESLRRRQRISRLQEVKNSEIGRSMYTHYTILDRIGKRELKWFGCFERIWAEQTLQQPEGETAAGCVKWSQMWDRFARVDSAAALRTRGDECPRNGEYHFIFSHLLIIMMTQTNIPMDSTRK